MKDALCMSNLGSALCNFLQVWVSLACSVRCEYSDEGRGVNNVGRAKRPLSKNEGVLRLTFWRLCGQCWAHTESFAPLSWHMKLSSLKTSFTGYSLRQQRAMHYQLARQRANKFRSICVIHSNLNIYFLYFHKSFYITFIPIKINVQTLQKGS